MRATGPRPFVALDESMITSWSLLHASRWRSAIAILERRSSRSLPDEPDRAPAPVFDEKRKAAQPSEQTQ